MLTWVANNLTPIGITAVIFLIVVGRAFLHSFFGAPDQTEQGEQPVVRQQPERERVVTTPPAPAVAQQRQQSLQRPVSYHQLQRQRMTLTAYIMHRVDTWIANRPILVRQPASFVPPPPQAPVPVGHVTIVEENTDLDTFDDDDTDEPEEEQEQEEEEKDNDVVVQIPSPEVVTKPVAHGPQQPASPPHYINTQQLLTGESFNLNKMMHERPEIYLSLVRGLILDLYMHYAITHKITRDGMVPLIYSQVHWNHLIGGIAPDKQGVLRKAGIVAVLHGETGVGYQDVQMACKRFRQWFIDEEQGTKPLPTVSAKEPDSEHEEEDTEEREENKYEEE